jgi:Ni,Fe-hydrogenase maturation factor
MKIYVSGNKLVKKDSLPLKIMPKLRKHFPEIEFKELDPTENLPSENLIVIDTVLGIDKVKIFSDIDSFKSASNYSVHDYDFLFELKLNKKLGKLKNIKILGIPANLTEKETFDQLKKEIGKLDS